MACFALEDIEELALCSCCKCVFDDAERAPKILACKHHFCLACTRGVLGGSREVRCVHCWKRTELPEGRAEALPTYAAVLALARKLAPEPPCATHALPALWCAACGVRACRACDHSHHAHSLRPPREARIQLQRDARLLLADLQRLAVRQREFLLRALDAATALKVRLEAELAAPGGLLSATERALIEIDYAFGSLATASSERDRLRARHAEALLQCRLDDLIRNASVPLDFELMRRALAGLGAGEFTASTVVECRDPILFLANYCTAQLYTRHCLARRARLLDGATDSVAATLELDAAPDILSDAVDASPGATSGTTVSNAAVGSPILRNPIVFPLFYFNIEVNGSPFGRVVVEVREDVAPRMSRNFSILTTGELGLGYRGCSVFQCWENESIITGDFELNNGRGGRSVFEESFFMPDDTKMVAVRGAVGMRRSQKRHDNLGMVGSQFRIMLREIRGFTAIFAFVVEGLDVVDRLSRTGDSAGKPHSSIIIASCGKLN
ncbi:peptidyl-prolyl cis-trans isomerase E [Vanessa tameamea]|uniref:Peptidyl-prolyl cis-trans isomerase E n=1 Tax=Vanessa tameamea TaxID=334116 RepID=A0A8B8HUQ0_VANTA